MQLGPLEMVVIAFPGERIQPAVINSFATTVASGAVTIIDLLIVRKGADGSAEIEEFDVSSAGGFDLSEKLDLVTPEDCDAIAEGLQPGTCAAVIVYEQTWAKAFAAAVLDAGGQVAARLSIPFDVVQAATAAAE